jgi:hypothetical protein
LQWVEVIILGGGGEPNWLLEGDPPQRHLIWSTMARASSALAVDPRPWRSLLGRV